LISFNQETLSEQIKIPYLDPLGEESGEFELYCQCWDEFGSTKVAK
jgi:hypothetical protein